MSLNKLTLFLLAKIILVLVYQLNAVEEEPCHNPIAFSGVQFCYGHISRQDARSKCESQPGIFERVPTLSRQNSALVLTRSDVLWVWSGDRWWWKAARKQEERAAVVISNWSFLIIDNATYHDVYLCKENSSKSSNSTSKNLKNTIPSSKERRPSKKRRSSKGQSSTNSPSSQTTSSMNYTPTAVVPVKPSASFLGTYIAVCVIIVAVLIAIGVYIYLTKYTNPESTSAKINTHKVHSRTSGKTKKSERTMDSSDSGSATRPKVKDSRKCSKKAMKQQRRLEREEMKSSFHSKQTIGSEVDDSTDSSSSSSGTNEVYKSQRNYAKYLNAA